MGPVHSPRGYLTFIWRASLWTPYISVGRGRPNSACGLPPGATGGDSLGPVWALQCRVQLQFSLMPGDHEPLSDEDPEERKYPDRGGGRDRRKPLGRVRVDLADLHYVAQ